MTIAVTGITGHSGGFFLRQLIDNGFNGKLRCLVRESSDTTALDASGLDVEKYYGDIESVDDMVGFLTGADTLMHIAGIRRTLTLLEAAQRTGGTAHLVLVHTTGIFSKHKMASQEYKEIEEKMEKYLDAGLNVTILRPTMIFGDMCDHNISKFIKMVAKFPIMPEINHGRGLIQPVNARDLGQAYYKACMAEKLPQLSYNISGEKPISLHDMLAMAGSFMGKDVRFISAPMWLGVSGAQAVKLLTGGKKDLVEKVLRMGEDRCFSHEDAQRDFGYEPEKFETGLKREVEEFMKLRENKADG